jgi:hypothetical protein
MKFNEIKVGEKFIYNNTEYSKIPEVKISCCKVKHNCETTDGTKAVLKPLDEVQKIEETT